MIEDKFSFGQVKLKVVAEHWGQDVQNFLGNMSVDFITRGWVCEISGYTLEMEEIIREIIKRKEIQNQNLENASPLGLKVELAEKIDQEQLGM